MKKQVDELYHFTKSFDSLRAILSEGFKPSYANENIVGKNILVPMISFSNILLRDVGKDEVLHYGDYSIGFSREWGINNDINPVNYTYDSGVLEKSVETFLYNTIFVKYLRDYKKKLSEWHKIMGNIKFSEKIYMTNTPPEVMKIIDHITLNYNEELIDLLSDYASSIFSANSRIIRLTKPYLVTDNKGEIFIAYNDREWRKVYSEIEIELVFGEDSNYIEWINKPKPHFSEDEFRLKFDIKEVKTITVSAENERLALIQDLFDTFGKQKIELLIQTKQLKIDIIDNLKTQ